MFIHFMHCVALGIMGTNDIFSKSLYSPSQAGHFAPIGITNGSHIRPNKKILLYNPSTVQYSVNEPSY